MHCRVNRISFRFPLVCAAIAANAGAISEAATLIPDRDVMTSSFFTGDNLVRGYPGDGRAVHRVSTDVPFGTPGAETIYLSFADFSPGDYTGSVPGAVLTLQSISGGFGGDAGAGNPFTVSAHGVTTDPFAAILDDTNPGGTISWIDFYNNEILDADAAGITAVETFGAIEFDVTALVNDWISGANSEYFIALTGKSDASGNDFLHGFVNESETPGSTYLTIIPEPDAVALLGLGLAGLVWRRRRVRATRD